MPFIVGLLLLVAVSDPIGAAESAKSITLPSSIGGSIASSGPGALAAEEKAQPQAARAEKATASAAMVPRMWLVGTLLALLISAGVSIWALRSLWLLKKADASLRRSESQFRQITEKQHDVFWVMTPDFSRVDYVNPAYEVIWGRSQRSLYQDPMSWTESLFPHDRQVILDYFEEQKAAFPEGCTFPDFRIVGPEGTIRWLHVRTFTIKPADSSDHRIVGICQDITRSKFFEASLRESEQKWRALMENSPDHILLIDLDGHVLFANRRFVGIEPSHLIGKSLVALMAPEVRGLLKACMQAVVDKGLSRSCRVENKEEHRHRWVLELRMGPVTVNEQTVAIVVNATEVTRRVEQEKALRESEAFHRTVFNETPIGMAIQDFSGAVPAIRKLIHDGVEDLRAHLMAHPDEVSRLAEQVFTVKVNPALMALYQAPGETSMLGPLRQWLKTDDRQHFIDQVAAFAGGQDRYDGEARNLDFQGRVLHLIIRKVVIQRSVNGLSKILTSLIDVTPLKTAEKDREVLMLQLQQAQKMEAIGTLAGGVAHDFNNILSVILGNAELAVADTPAHNPVSQNLQEIKQASLRAKDIVRQLLGISRRSDQRLNPIHLMPVVEEAIQFLRAAIPANIEIHASLAVDNDVVRADATQIHQILINLFTNASHAMEARGGRLSVWAANVALSSMLPGTIHSINPGDYLRVTVADTGTGIPDAIKGRIFDPYFTTKPQGKGTGMGLSMVHGIMKNSGGGVVLKSNPGEGTRFDLYFPIADEPTPEAAAPEETLRSGSERILFVDDEAMIVKLTGKILDRLGYRVKTCTEPQRALSLIESDPGAFDLLIVDLSMPDMTGDQLVQAIRELRPDLPVILCTGNTERLAPEKIEALRIEDVLEKPVPVARLASVIRKVLDRASPPTS